MTEIGRPRHEQQVAQSLRFLNTPLFSRPQHSFSTRRPPWGCVPKVLLVDQSEALAEALRAEKRQVLAVPDVEQAFIVAAAFRPDVIVLGLSQTGHAGLLSAAMLKLDAATARVPLICLLDSGTEPSAALALGCALALPQSVTPTALAAAIDRLVGSRLDGEAPRP